MSEKLRIQQILDSKGMEPGALVEVISSEGHTVRGILMPHHEFSQEDIVTIKLGTGYNIGIRPRDADSVILISKPEPRTKLGREIPTDSSKKTVSIISTGGTIASYVDYRTGAVHPAISAEELVFSVPELLEICNIKAEVLCSVLSENMRAENWKQLAEMVAKHLNEGSMGCIIPHGTDTMGFTAAALAFSLSNLTGPVILVGSQRSSDRPSSDATINLLSAARLCTESDLAEVVVLMHATVDDAASAVHRGTRVRKNHSSRRDAFQSVNEPPLGFVADQKIRLEREHTSRSSEKVQADAEFDEEIVLVQFHPGMSVRRFEAYTEGAHGVVIAGTGLGHVSQDILSCIRDLTDRKVPVCITTQCIWGATNLNVYSTGRDMIAAGAIPLGDMLSETAFVKLSWILGHTRELDKIRQLMQSNERHEISERRCLQ